MNDRIEELAQQANTDLDGAIPIGFAEKFAELLIRECVQVASDHVGEIEGVDFGLIDACYRHFGVEK